VLQKVDFLLIWLRYHPVLHNNCQCLHISDPSFSTGRYDHAAFSGENFAGEAVSAR